MSMIDDLFTNLRREKRKALMPFVTAGDPDLEFTAAVLQGAGRAAAATCARSAFPTAIRSPTGR